MNLIRKEPNKGKTNIVIDRISDFWYNDNKNDRCYHEEEKTMSLLEEISSYLQTKYYDLSKTRARQQTWMFPIALF